MIFGKKAIGTVAYLGGLPAILESFTWSWSQMVQYNQEFLGDEKGFVHTMRATFSDHGPARNSLVSGFLGDWLIQFDTDHEFEPDICWRMVRLANECGIDVLSAVYQLKKPPHLPVLFQWVEGNGSLGLQPLATWPKEAKLLEIGSAGGGCLFVRRKVFDMIANNYQEGAFDKITPYSEDHSFFCRCKALGIKCYAAPNIYCILLRVVPVTLEDLDTSGLLTSDQFAVDGYK